MAKKTQEKLSQELVDFLQGERIVSIVTYDKETKKPTVSTISWVVAQQGGEQIKFAVGHNASVGENIQADPFVALSVIGPESCYEITGTGSVSDIYQGTMKYRVVTIDVESVEDVIFYGGKISVVPAYEKTYNADLAKKLDDEIYGTLRG